MIAIKNLAIGFVLGLAKPTPTITAYNTETQNASQEKTKSLACLVYENRKQKGLINNENNDCPIIYFGDEWSF